MLTGPHKKAEAAPRGTASFLLQHMVDELLEILARNIPRSSPASRADEPLASNALLSWKFSLEGLSYRLEVVS